MKEKKLIIKDIQGEIYVISQDGSIKMLKDGDEIYAGEKIFTKNLDAKITLEDGEQVNLSAHQSINLDEILKISTKPAEEKGESERGYGSSASDGISLSAASFITSGHSANIHQIYNQHRYLDPNVSSAQPSELKSISGASSTLIEKSSTAAGPKEEPFIDTINVLNVTNRGLDANIWLYDSARNGGRLLDYYRLEPSKSIFKEWIANHNVSATSTYDDLRYRVGEGYGFSRPANEVLILQDRNIRPEELARMGQDKNIESINKIDRLNNPILSYGRPEKPNGNYRLNESKIVSDGVINIIDGWIYIKNRNSLEYFLLFEKHKRSEVKIEFDGRTILEESFSANTLEEPNSENHKPTEALNLAHDGGFYKIHIEVIDERYNYAFNLMAQEKGKAGHSYLADVAGIKLVSNAYMEALAQNHLVTKESDTFYKAAKKPDGTIFGSNANDFNEPYSLEFKGTKDVGSNDDDKFIFNSHDIDAKGGIDTLVFTQNVDLTKISELDKRLESFERIELDHTKAVKLKLNGQNIIDMIDSNPTADAHGKVSLNTILKISGDDDDVVQLVGNFVKATSGEVAALNEKHSVIGADYNKLTVEPSGDAVNQVYKGENNAGQTFFVEIQKDVHVEVM